MNSTFFRDIDKNSEKRLVLLKKRCNFALCYLTDNTMGRILLALSCMTLFSFSHNVCAEPGYRSSELKRLTLMMQINVDSLHEGQNVVSVRGRDVILRCFHGQVQNVGYRLFSDDMRRAIHSPVLDFLERYFL